MNLAMKKALVGVQGGGGAAAKLSVAKPEAKAPAKAPQQESPREGGARKMSAMSAMLSKNMKLARDAGDAPPEGAPMGRKPSLFAAMSSRTSISGASEGKQSMVGLMASRRWARRISTKKESTVGEPAAPVIQYEPTYQLEPKKKFQTAPVKEICKELIDGRLKDMRYSARLTPNIDKMLSEEIKEAVKKLGFERYKIVVVVMIGEKKGQGVMASSRCSWDEKMDNFVTHTFQNKNIFCSCSVFASYKE